MATKNLVPRTGSQGGIGTDTKPWKEAIFSTGSFQYISSSLIPDASESWDLGSADKPWKEIYVSTSSINFVNPSTGTVLQTMSATSDGFSFGASGDAIISGSTVSGSKLHIVGTAFIGGNLTLGDAATDSISIGADLTSNLIPNADNTYDLGSSGQQWKDLYVNGIGYIDQLGTDGDPVAIYVNSGELDGVTIGGESAAAATVTTLSATGDVDLGNATSDTITVTARFDSDIVPSSDSTRDLGTSALQFAEAHIDTGHIDDITATGTSTLTTVDINGGAIDGTIIGANSAAAGTFTNLTVTTDVNIDDSGGDGAIDGVIIGASTAAAGTFTTLNTTGLTTIGDASGDTLTINAATINPANIAAGTDNTVVVYNGSTLLTDEIDSRVWGTTLVDTDGSGTNNELATWSDSNSIIGEGNLTFDGSTLTVTGALTTTGNGTYGNAVGDTHTFTGHITSSGHISGSSTSTGSFGAVTMAEVIGNWTNAGNTVADLGTITTVDINGGTINGITDLAVADGGTGASTFTDGGILLGSGTSAITATAVLGDGEILIGDGSTDPTTLDIGSSTAITTLGTISTGVWEGTTIAVDQGGTGATSLNNLITLGTHTTGNYVATLTAGALIDLQNNSGETASPTIDVDLTEAGEAAIANGDYILFLDGGATGTHAKEAIADVATLFAGTGLTATNSVIAIDAADTTTTSILNSSLGKIGTAAAQEYITFGTSNEVNTFIDNTERHSVTAAGVNITGALTVSGNLTVNGTTSYISSSVLEIGDRIITLNSGNAAGDGGLHIIDTDSAETGSLLWDVSADRWIGGLSGSEVTIPTISSTDTLTNKTLTTPTIGNFSNATHTHANAANGGQITLGTGTTGNYVATAVAGTGISVSGATGNVTISSAITAGDGLTLNTADIDIDAAQTTITSILNTSLVVGRDSDNDIDFATDNNIIFRAGGEDQLTLVDGALTPSSNAIVDLGTDALEFKDAYFDGTVEADAITIGGSTLASVIQGTTVTNATNAAHVSVADNESTDENNLIPFIEDTSATGNVGLESDGDFHYNPSTGRLTATQLAGTLQTAAQGNITSLGTLTTLTVDDITINDSTISDGGDLTIDVEGDITLDANGADIILKDDGTAFGRFKRDTSDFVIKSETNDKDILFKGVDNSSTITALSLDMSEGGNAEFSGNVSGSATSTGSFGSVVAAGTGINTFAGKVGIGLTNPSNLLHVEKSTSGTFLGYINNTHADGYGLKVKGGQNAGDYAFLVEAQNSADHVFRVLGDGTTEFPKANAKVSGSSTSTGSFGRLGLAVGGGVDLPDNVKLNFGDGSDLQIYHGGSNSVIKDAGTGGLILRATELKLMGDNTSEEFLVATENAGVDIYYDDSKKFETVTGGVTITGKMTSDSARIDDATAASSKTTGALIVDGGVGVGLDIHAGGDVVAYASSDIKLKDNIEVIEDSLDKISEIRGVKFDWNEESPEWAQERGHDVGVIAQEVQKVLPEIVTERTNGYLGVDYKRLIPLLIESIKELKQEVEDLKKKVN